MTEEKTRLISEEKGDILKPNFNVEDLRKMVKKNGLEKLKAFIMCSEDVAKDKSKKKSKEKTISISDFNDFDYLNFALILMVIDDGGIITQGHYRGESLIPKKIGCSSKPIDKTGKQELLKILFNKFCDTYKFKDINSYICREVGNELNKAEEELNKIDSPIKLLTLLEIINFFLEYNDPRFNFSEIIGLKLITKFNKNYFNNIEENFKKRCLDLMTQILKDCLNNNVYKLEKDELLCFLDFIVHNLCFINEKKSNDIKYFSDIQNLTSNIINYFFNVSDFNVEFNNNFFTKLNEILLRIENPKINFGDINARFNDAKDNEKKIIFILPFLIYMNILSSDKTKKNYIIDLLIKDGNIIYLRDICKKCLELNIEEIKDPKYKFFYNNQFKNFKDNVIENYVGDIINFINYCCLNNFGKNCYAIDLFLQNFWNPKRTDGDNFTLYKLFEGNEEHFRNFIACIDFAETTTAKKEFCSLEKAYENEIDEIKMGKSNKEMLKALQEKIEKEINEMAQNISKTLNMDCNKMNHEKEQKRGDSGKEQANSLVSGDEWLNTTLTNPNSLNSSEIRSNTMIIGELVSSLNPSMRNSQTNSKSEQQSNMENSSKSSNQPSSSFMQAFKFFENGSKCDNQSNDSKSERQSNMKNSPKSPNQPRSLSCM